MKEYLYEQLLQAEHEPDELTKQLATFSHWRALLPKIIERTQELLDENHLVFTIWQDKIRLGYRGEKHWEGTFLLGQAVEEVTGKQIEFMKLREVTQAVYI